MLTSIFAPLASLQGSFIRYHSRHASNFKGKTRILAGAVGAGLLFFIAANAKAVTVVALEGQQAFGQTSGVKYWQVGEAILAPNGEIAFSSGVSVMSTGPQTTVGYIGQPASFQVFAKQGDALSTAGPADTITGPAFSSLSNTGVGVGMDIIFGANSGPQSRAICMGNASSFVAIAAPGQISPTGFAYSGFSTPVISTDGVVAFSASLAAPSAASGMFVYANQTTTTVALAGSTAPGLPFNFFNFSDPSISDNGIVAFIATTRDSNGTGPTGLWSNAGGSLQLIASSTNAAPGAGSGALFSTFETSTPVVNRAGQVAFQATLIHGGTITSTNDKGIWTNLSGSLALVAREGDQAPGFPAGVTYGAFTGGEAFDDPVLNNGMIAFSAPLTGSTAGDAIFGGPVGAIAPLVVAGQPVAGLPAFFKTVGFYDLNMNASGQLVFYADITGPGINQNDAKAILAYDPQGGVSLIAWGEGHIAGTNITPDNGLDFYSGTDEDHPNVLSDSGLVAFTAFSSTGSAIIVTAIPEPASLSLLLPLLLAFTTRSKSSRMRSHKRSVL